MNVHFGVVQKYFPQKGFGFVKHPLNPRTRKEVFFHISNVPKSLKGIVEKLSSYEPGDDIYFWYEAENTRKGEQVKRILRTEGIGELLKSNLHNFTHELEFIWQDIETLQPFWLCDVTLDLIGIDGLNKLKLERESLEKDNKDKKDKKEAEELQQKERDRLKKIELEKIENERRRIEEEKKKQLELQKRQQKIEEEEFELLVAEMEQKNFTMSAQVSNYIINNRLGEKYKHISGVLVMENNSSIFEFNGGFPTNVYAKLCERLNLGNKRTKSRVVSFTAFKDL